MKVLVFYSGGKDSQASLIWSIKKYGVENCEAVFCDTGWENPVTYQHITVTCKDLGVKLVILKSTKYDGMVDLATKKKRFPSVKAKFCTEELKSKPAIDYILSHSEHLITIEGIRKNESLSRSKMMEACTYFRYYFEPIRKDKKGNYKYHTYRKKEVLKWCNKYNADKIRPVFNWTAEQVISYIKENGQQPNPLYFQGFSRVGCFPCINANQRELKLIIENHTERWQYVKYLEKTINSSIVKIDTVPIRFTANKLYTTAEDVEKYLKDKNNTIDMFDQETPSCMSVYGLCE